MLYQYCHITLKGPYYHNVEKKKKKNLFCIIMIIYA